jgi:hypothetical protein
VVIVCVNRVPMKKKGQLCLLSTDFLYFMFFFSSDVITCSKCYEKTPREQLILDRGFKNDMRTLEITCSFCDWADILKNYLVSSAFFFFLLTLTMFFFKDHLNKIHPNPKCIYCGEYFSTVNEMDRHQHYVCEKMTINCPFKQFGCEEMVHSHIYFLIYSLKLFL